MKIEEVLAILREVLKGDELIVSCNGNISRVAYHLLPKPQLYLRGSMGLPIPIGLGLALSQPKKTVIVLTGDGNLLMGLSSLATTAYMSPSNLKIIILDNEVYATTGGQETISKILDYPKMIQGMGINSITSIDSLRNTEGIKAVLVKAISEHGLQVVHIKVKKERSTFKNIPWHPTEITQKFKRQNTLRSKNSWLNH